MRAVTLTMIFVLLAMIAIIAVLITGTHTPPMSHARAPGSGSR